MDILLAILWGIAPGLMAMGLLAIVAPKRPVAPQPMPMLVLSQPMPIVPTRQEPEQEHGWTIDEILESMTDEEYAQFIQEVTDGD